MSKQSNKIVICQVCFSLKSLFIRNSARSHLPWVLLGILTRENNLKVCHVLFWASIVMCNDWRVIQDNVCEMCHYILSLSHFQHESTWIFWIKHNEPRFNVKAVVWLQKHKFVLWFIKGPLCRILKYLLAETQYMFHKFKISFLYP